MVWIVIFSIVLIPLLLFLGLFLYLYFSTLNVKARSKKALKKIDEKSPYRKSPPPRMPHNRLYAKVKDKEKELKELSEEKDYALGLQKYEEQGVEVQEVGDQVEIVGLAEPKGFWSRFIMNQKGKFIMARLNMQKSSDKGFWTNLIKAQSIQQGKSQGRGR